MWHDKAMLRCSGGAMQAATGLGRTATSCSTLFTPYYSSPVSPQFVPDAVTAGPFLGHPSWSKSNKAILFSMLPLLLLTCYFLVVHRSVKQQLAEHHPELYQQLQREMAAAAD